ncbi:MAG: TIGR04219 family outer membrane beta-barrel protein [Campylobacterales bacterium]|nr:TIGR04219 family outer membrane beta-barrel protein [Campylobacterales bacterium]
MLKSALFVSFIGVSVASAATILGFGAEADYYSPTVSGNFSYTGNGTTTDTYFSDDTQSSYQLSAYLEHPLPMLPNLRIDYTPETTFSGADSIIGTNNVSFKQLDGTLYYELLDNVVDLDVGVTFKAIDGKIEGSANQDFNVLIPMLYLSTGIKIPVLPIHVVGDVKYVGYNGDSVIDARVKAMWDIFAGLQAQAGLRYESMKIDNRENINANVTFKGPFIGLGYAF